MDQTFVNTLIAVVGVLMGWVLKVIWEGQKDLRSDGAIRDNRLAELEVLVAGKYATREDFLIVISKLDDIRDRLALKADRADCDMHRRVDDRGIRQ